MARQLKITGDTSELKKSIMDLGRTITKDLGKSKIDLFSPDTKKFLRTEAVALAADLGKKIDNIKKSTEAHKKALEQVIKGSKEELEIKEKILKASQHILNTEKERVQTQEMVNDLSQSGFMRGLKKSLAKIPGLSKLGGLAGMGAMGGAGMLLGGGALAAGAYGVSRVMAGRNTFTEGVDTRLKLRGRGINEMGIKDMAGANAAGLNSLSLRQAQLRDMDVFGKEGSTQKSIIDRAKFERNFGIDEGTMSGIGGQLRGNLGGKGANQTVMKLQAALIASGITDAIGPYLETAANMLTELNERGFTMDDSVLALFNAMSKTGMGEGRISKLALGADAGIRGATGESNALMQTVFNKAGIGGGTIGGAQAGMRMGGLFGTDLEKFKAMSPQDKKMFQMLGIGGSSHMKNVAGATLGTLDSMFGSEKDIGKQLGSRDKRTREGGALKRLSRLRYVMSTFGLQDEGQAAEVEGLLGKAKTAGPIEQKRIRDRIKEIQESTPELENLKKINQSNEGILDILKHEKTTLEDLLGEATAAPFNSMNSFLNSIDSAILAIAKFLTGYQTADERAAEVKAEQDAERASGQRNAKNILDMGGAMPGQLKQVQNLSFEEGVEFTKEVKRRADEEKSKGFFGNSQYQKMFDSPELKMFRKGMEGAERKRQRENFNNSRNFTPASGATPANPPVIQIPGLENALNKTNQLMSKNVRASEITAKNSKEKGSLKPSSSSTTGN